MKGLTEAQQLILANDKAIEATIAELRSGNDILKPHHIRMIAIIKQLNTDTFEKKDIHDLMDYYGYHIGTWHLFNRYCNELRKLEYIKPLGLGRQWFTGVKYTKTHKIDYLLRRYSTHYNQYIKDHF